MDRVKKDSLDPGEEQSFLVLRCCRYDWSSEGRWI